MSKYLQILVTSLSFANPAAPTIVIDPGHGGTNLGAPTLDGSLFEKALTLDLARRLEAELKELEPGLRIVLTREGDRYVSLRGRTLMANQLGADIFVSLHFNASGSGQREGFETYVYGKGGPRPASDSPLAHEILDDLRRRSSSLLSVQLAAIVQRHLASTRGSRRDRGVRAAPFDVLREAQMPAVLIEAGFVDHPSEGRDVLQPASRQRTARAIAQALVDFHRQRARLSSYGLRFARR